jgi:hypothetical protein
MIHFVYVADKAASYQDLFSALGDMYYDQRHNDAEFASFTVHMITEVGDVEKVHFNQGDLVKIIAEPKVYDENTLTWRVYNLLEAVTAKIKLCQAVVTEDAIQVHA